MEPKAEPRPRPLGWLPAVPEIERMVRETINPIASERAIRRQINYDTLSYYYGGEVVLVRTDFEDERGVEVIAVGDEAWPTLRAMSLEDRHIYGIATPDPWDSL
jgi:hypothetical protein